MKTPSTTIAIPARIGLCYVLSLTVVWLLCLQFLGKENILEYARRSRPYSFLLDPNSREQQSGNAGRVSIICFGDSTYFMPPHGWPSLSERETYMTSLLYQELTNQGNLTNLDISDCSYLGASMYDYYCLFHQAAKFSPNLIIVPVNWKSFGHLWRYLLKVNPVRELSAFVPLRENLPPDFESPVRARGITPIAQIGYKISIHVLYIRGIKAWALRSMERALHLRSSDRTPAHMVDSEALIAEQTKVTDSATTLKTLQVCFPLDVNESNPTFRNYRALTYAASQGKTKVLFFLWPMDLEYFNEVSYLDRSVLRISRQLIIETAEERNLLFVDLSELLGHEDFYDIHGHCTVEGRRKIARALMPAILEALNDDSGHKR